MNTSELSDPSDSSDRENISDKIYERTFIFSSDYFNSYEVIGDIRYLDSLDNIIHYCVKDLIETLEKHNLVNLVDKCKTCEFHIHTYTFDEILLCKPETIIYLCEGCNAKNNISLPQ